MASVRIDFYDFYSPQTLVLSQNAKVTDLLPLVRNRLAADAHFRDAPHNIRLWLKMSDENPSWFDQINGSLGLLPKTGEVGKFLLPENDCLSIVVEKDWSHSNGLPSCPKLGPSPMYEERPYEDDDEDYRRAIAASLATASAETQHHHQEESVPTGGEESFPISPSPPVHPEVPPTVPSSPVTLGTYEENLDLELELYPDEGEATNILCHFNQPTHHCNGRGERSSCCDDDDDTDAGDQETDEDGDSDDRPYNQ
eukprot:TRINITY_DN11416_c0_g4_i5.p1 TRINITY_DN11416_c0_g4~~TRINITY_DN11416_c0_g4_i5.p1  ORF type:complete len:254 (+),score=49.54 TRINITY_DN11416_c0_g4_i5:73-834(+)